MYNKEFLKFEKLKGELQSIRGYCGHQYFAVEKCPGPQGCAKQHVDRCFYPCIHYFTGNCKYGFNCHFSHSLRRQVIRPEPDKDTCKKLYYDNYCPMGGKCRYSHDLKAYPCVHNTLGKCKFSSEDCRYSHDKLVETPVICFFDLMGSCRNKPEECPNTHVGENAVKYLSYDGTIM